MQQHHMVMNNMNKKAPARQVLGGRRRQQQSCSAKQTYQVVQYPEFRGPEHGPTFDFEVDSLPVVNFDALFTNVLWDLLVTETNRYTRQKNVNNWNDTTREEMRCFIGFLFGISINNVAEINDIWSSDWVVACPAFANFLPKTDSGPCGLMYT